MSNEKNLGWLFDIGDYTTQFYRDYNKPLYGSLLNKQYNAQVTSTFPKWPEISGISRWFGEILRNSPCDIKMIFPWQEKCVFGGSSPWSDYMVNVYQTSMVCVWMVVWQSDSKILKKSWKFLFRVYVCHRFEGREICHTCVFLEVFMSVYKPFLFSSFRMISLFSIFPPIHILQWNLFPQRKRREP